ncbi:HEAT repeat-containing protein 6-like isoform X2 [Lineus longissimus]|uniref:HEAT repeat-containing protein 6-like isoform X2 n=1 Tax=Lineus longissimus TaxID=88925 RepID=UPI002B4F0FFB
MADDSEFLRNEQANFRRYSSRLASMVFRNDENFRVELNQILDQLNALEYAVKIAGDQDAFSVLCQCCMLVSTKDELLVTKVCQLIVNITSRQQITLNQSTFDILLEYLVNAVQICHSWALPDILRALGSVLYENGGRAQKFFDVLIGWKGLLLKMAHVDVKDEGIQRGALQCIENICMRTVGYPYPDDQYVATCFRTFLHFLQSPKREGLDDVSYCRLLVSSLKGLNNILTYSPLIDPDQLGVVLAALKVFMLLGLPGSPAATQLTTLHPTPVSQYDPNPAPSPKSQEARGREEEEGGKGQKKKMRKRKGARKGKEDGEQEDMDQVESQVSSLKLLDNSMGQTDNFPLQPAWRVSSSDSEYSDTEGGQASKLRSYQSKVRQLALGCLLSIVKKVERRRMFGYWSHFIPDIPTSRGSPPQPTLFTPILRDPSFKVRTGALLVLTALLDGSKQYLAVADDSDQHKTAFTPFSVTLGFMIKEIHRCLLLALSAENASLTLTQLIKCLGTLVVNVPYGKLRPGLLGRIVRQIKGYLNHRDPNVRVACLTCLGSVCSVQAPLLEVTHILQAQHPSNQAVEPNHMNSPRKDNGRLRTESQGAECAPPSPGHRTPTDSGITTPSSSSGSMTPRLADVRGVMEASWVTKYCIMNVTPQVLNNDLSASGRLLASQGAVEPLPVRLESLQVLNKLVKHYFPSVRSNFLLLKRVVQCCLEDQEHPVQLHGAKLLEELGQTLLPPQHTDLPLQAPPHMDTEQSFEFWIEILNRPLLGALQNQENSALRATGCDCLSTIGSDVFEKLPLDKRIMCITLLLGHTNDEDKNVKAAAIRALGVYVHYQCLREDVSFMADVANAILVAMADANIAVRMKAAWSMGNISDAICLNKDQNDADFILDFSDMLLQKMLTVAAKGSQDNDKVKSNSVRALGNLLRYMPERSLEKSSMMATMEQSVLALIKNVGTGTMKVRWNACYAFSNMFRNNLLPLGRASWTVCGTLGHLSSIIQLSDIPTLGGLVKDKDPILKDYFTKYKQRNGQNLEKMTMLSKTCAHLKSQQSETQDATSIETLGLLIDVYTVETVVELSEESLTPEKTIISSGFRQVYD